MTTTFWPLLAAALIAAQSAGAWSAESASQRLERLAAESYERSLDLFPVGETMGRGAGPRQDKVELTFTAEHRERQRAHYRWVLGELDGIPTGDLAPSEKLTHSLLGYRSRESLEWLQYPFHQHSIFIQLGGGVPSNLIRLVSRQPFRNEADYRAWFTRLGRYPAFFDGAAGVMHVRAFHDAFLAEGHLPLSMARERMDTWIEEQARK